MRPGSCERAAAAEMASHHVRLDADARAMGVVSERSAGLSDALCFISGRFSCDGGTFNERGTFLVAAFQRKVPGDPGPRLRPQGGVALKGPGDPARDLPWFHRIQEHPAVSHDLR